MEVVVEVAVFFSEFTNLELLKKGLYRVDASAACGSVRGIPIASIAAPPTLLSRSRDIECEDSDEGAMPGGIDEAALRYMTRAVSCRYVDESFMLGETVQFRFALPAALWRAGAAPAVELTLRLQRAEFGPRPPPGKAAAAGAPAAEGSGPRERLSDFAVVSTRVVALPWPVLPDLQRPAPIESYQPVVFDSMNLCVVGTVTQTALITTMQFPPPPPPPLPLPSSSASASLPTAGVTSPLSPASDAASVASTAPDSVGGTPSAAAAPPLPHPHPPPDRGATLLRWAAETADAMASVAHAAVKGPTGGVRGWLSGLRSGSATPAAVASGSGSGSGGSGASAAAPAPPAASGQRSRRSLAAASSGDGVHAALAAATPWIDGAATVAEALFPRWRAHQADWRTYAVAVRVYDAEVAAAAAAAASAAAAAAASAAAVTGVPASALMPSPTAAPPPPPLPPLPPPTAPPADVPPVLPDEAQAVHNSIVAPLVAMYTFLATRVARVSASADADAALLRTVRMEPHEGANVAPHRFAADARAAAEALVRRRQGAVADLLHSAGKMGATPPPTPAPARASGDGGTPVSTGGGVYDVAARLRTWAGWYSADGMRAAGQPPPAAGSGGAAPPPAFTVADGFGATIGGGGGGVVAFAERAAAALADPECVAAALAAEVNALSSDIYLLWRKLQRHTAHTYGADLRHLQSVYRAAALLDARASIVARRYPVTCLTDADAAPPLAIARCARRRAFGATAATIDALGAAEWAPTDAVAATLPATLAVTAFTYATQPPPGAAAAATAAGATRDRSYARDRMEAFTDSDDEDGGASASASSADADGGDIRHSAGAPLTAAPCGASGVTVSPPASAGDSPSTTPDRRLSQGGATPVASGAHHVGAAASLPGGDTLHAAVAAAATAAAAAAGATVVAPDVPSHATHVVVFLNGLGGTTHDTRLLRSYLKLAHPHVLAYVTTSNQAKSTEGDIVEAAARVAKEVHDLLVFKLPEDGLTLQALSFVAFSLGGVVARLALRHPLLRPFLPLCHAFVTVASPHLGLLYSQSAVVSAGVFLFRQWRSSVALSQLSYTDEDASGADGIRNSLLYLLAVGWESKLAPLPPPPLPAAPAAVGGARGSRAGSSASANGVGGGVGSGGSSGLTLPAGGRAPLLPGALRMYERAGAAAAAAGAGAEVADAVAARDDAGATGEHDGGGGASSGGGGGGDGSVASPAPLAHDVASRDTSGDFSDIADALEAEEEEERRVAPPRTLLPAAPKTVASLHRHGFTPCTNGAVLAHFAHVIMLYSDQDSYAPGASCAVQWCDAALADAKHGGAYGEMLRGYFDGVAPTAVTRWAVHFKTLSSIFAGKISVDSLLGREAHVSFLEAEQVAYTVALGLDHVWDTRLHPPRAAHRH